MEGEGVLGKGMLSIVWMFPHYDFRGLRMDTVTVVITSSDRHDLLRRTLDSFLRHNTYEKIHGILVMEDSYTYPRFLDEEEKYAQLPVSVLHTRPRLGQLLGIDVAYKYVTTDYIFHCEDDWEFYADGFIESSLAILESAPEILQVHLRRLDDVFTNGEMTYTVDSSGRFALVGEGRMGPFSWYGFSFNPGLRRLADYKLLGSYSSQLLTPRYSGQHFENYIGTLYKDLGFKAAIDLGNNGQGYVRHIGDNRHVF